MKSVLLLSLLLAVASVNFSCNPESKALEKRAWTEQERALLVDRLESIRDSLVVLTESLSEPQWSFRQDSGRWCIGEVVTHLYLHDALFFREIKSITALPAPNQLADSLLDEDSYLGDYAQILPENSGPAPWYLDPENHWCESQKTLDSFLQTRNHFIEFLNETDADLRKYYSTNGRGRKPYRDLHQLILVSVAHAQRHLQQIQNIKKHQDFPA